MNPASNDPANPEIETAQPATTPVTQMPTEPAAAPTEPLTYPEISSITHSTAPNEAVVTAKKDRSSIVKTVLLGIVNWLIIPIAIVFVLHNFVFQAFHVIGTSMAPTLSDTDYLIISKIGASGSDVARAFNKDDPYVPKRYEVIVFHYPKDPSLVFIKRVIGLPGDRVVVSGGKVTVYNKSFPNGFNPDTGTVRTKYPTLGQVDQVVPAGNVFVLGDNRTPNGSYDSRDWGLLPSSYIIGDAVVRLLPVNQAGIL